jgi:hypothetical protein
MRISQGLVPPRGASVARLGCPRSRQCSARELSISVSEALRVSAPKLVSMLIAIITASLCTLAQSGSVAASLSTRLDGGSKAVPSHLEGKIQTLSDRIEFEAFPQQEVLVWSCEQIKNIAQHRWPNREMVTVNAENKAYWFTFKSADQAKRLIDAANSVCK